MDRGTRVTHGFVRVPWQVFQGLSCCSFIIPSVSFPPFSLSISPAQSISPSLSLSRSRSLSLFLFLPLAFIWSLHLLVPIHLLWELLSISELFPSQLFPSLTALFGSNAPRRSLSPLFSSAFISPSLHLRPLYAYVLLAPLYPPPVFLYQLPSLHSTSPLRLVPMSGQL